MLRYIERNPVRAGLVDRAEDGPWSSAAAAGPRPALAPGPAPRDAAWSAAVAAPPSPATLARLRGCAARGAPFGTEAWVAATAARLGLESSLRPRGRPRRGAPGPPGERGGTTQTT